MKWMTIILAYVYWPLLYFTVYMPFIVPRLGGWRNIPFWITWPAIVGFIALLAACGMRRSHKAILIHSFAVALFLQVFIFAMSRLHMPGFLKSYEAGVVPDTVVPVFIVGIIAAALGETGRLVIGLKGRTSNQAVEATS